MSYLLDTNVCVACLRSGGRGPVWQRLRPLPTDQVWLCAVVKEELWYGALRSQQVARNLQLLTEFFDWFPASRPFDDPAARICSRLRAEFTRAGTPIGGADLMIAAIALTHDLTLVTHNTAEFGRVPGLRLEDWEA